MDVIASGSDGSVDANTTLFFWDVKNNVVKKYIDKIASTVFISGCSNTSGTYYKNGWQSGTGRVNIADIDDDGKLNASYVSGKFLYALDENWNLKWRVVVNEETSGYTGSTVYDFNGDGAAEVVYRDEQFLYIINGKDGSINTQQQCIARTNVEYPIVADINGDGSTELCVTCGFDDKLAWSNFCDLSYSVNSHVRVFESASLPWVPSRKLWNQHAYFNVNVNDDLTIPKVVQKHHLVWSNGTCTQGPNRPLNTFLNQTPFLDTRGCPTYASPDLINVKTLFKVNQPICPDKNFTVTMGVQNIGDVTMIGAVPVTFYKGDPRLAGAVKLNTVNVNVNLAKGQTQTFTNLTVTGTGGAFKLFISLNDAGTSVPTPIVLPNTSIIECSYDNVIDADILPKSVKVTALKVADNIKCLGATVPNNGAARAFVSVGGVENTVDYDFFWYNGTVVGAPNFTGTAYTALAAGTYRVFARNKAQGCNSDTATVVINRVDKAPLTVAIIVDKPNSSCGIPNGQFRAVVNGGDPIINYTFKWYEGNDIFTSPEIAAGNIASNLKGGKTYTVLVTDNFSGCQVVSSLAVPDITVTPLASASVAKNALCSPLNSGEVSATVGGVTIGYTFSWYNGAAAKPTADFTGATYSSIPAGAYTVIATETASGCKSAPVTVNVNTPAPFTVTAAQLAPQTSCNPLTPTGSATADVGGVTVGFTFNWFKGQSTAPADAVASSTNLASGIYTVKATNTTTGCSATAETTISQNLINPVVTLTPSPNAVCDPTKGTSAFTGSVTATVTYNGSAVTDFTPYQLVWHNGPLTTDPVITGATSKTISQLNGGSYTLVVTKIAEGCAASPSTVLVTNTPSLPSLITAQSPSHNCDAGPTGDGSAEVTQVNTISVAATTNFTYQWHAGIGTSTVITGQTNPKLFNLKGGASSNFTVLVTDKTTGCQNTTTVLVGDSRVLPVLSLKSTPNSICDAAKGFNGTALEDVLTDANGVGGDTYTYAWSTGNTMGSIIAGQTSSTLANQNGGFYTATVTNNRLNCTSNPETVEIKNTQVLPAISNVLTASTNCVGGAANGQIASSVTNGLVGETFAFQWFNGNTVAGSKVPDSPNNGNTATAIQLAGGTNYTVSVYNNVSGCENTLTSTLTDSKVLPVLTLKSTPNSICDAAKGFNGTALEDVLTDANGVGGDTYTYAWSTGNTMGSIVAGQTGSTLTNRNGGFYTATVTNNRLNCTSNPETVEIKNTQVLPAISNVLTASTNCVGGAANGQIASSVTNGLVGETFAFQWFNGNTVAGSKVPDSPNNGNTATAIQLAGGTNYTVSVYNNVSGCENTLTSTLTDSKVLPVLTLKSTPNSNCDAAKGFNGTALEDVLTDANGVGGDTYTYAWSTGNTMGSIVAGQTSSTLANQNGGFYTATVTNNRLNCTSNPETVEIKNTQVLPAISNVLTASTNCVGGAANGQIAASVTNGLVGETFAFQWFNGNTVAGSKVPDSPNNGNTATAIQLAGGTNYTVSVYNNVTGCENTLTSTLTDGKELPALTLTAQPNTICDATKATSGAFDGQVAADIVTVGNYATSVAADFEYTWDADPAVAGKRLLTNKDVGNYAVFVEHIVTKCKSTIYTAQVTTAKTLPTIVTDQQGSTNCAGGLADGIAQVTNVVPNGKHYTYNWYDGNTVAGLPKRQVANTTATTDNYTGVQGGLNGVSLFQYTVEVTVLESGCTNTEIIGVDDDSQVPVLGALVPTDNTLCTVAKNGSATVGTLTYRGVAVPPINYSDYTFVWSAGGTQGPPQTYTGLAAGSYTLTAQNNSSKCTSNPVNVSIHDNLFIPKIDVATVDQTSCDPLAPNGSVSASIDEAAIGGGAGVTAGYSFQWDDLIKPASVNTPTFASLRGNQNYTITVTRTATGCSNIQTVFLNETLTTPTVTVAVTNLTTCVPANGQLVATPNPAATYNFFWYNGNNALDENAVIAGANPAATTAIYSNLVPGDYTVVVQNATSKCKSSQVIKTVLDNSPKLTPVAQNITLPADCNAFGGVMGGAVQFISAKFSAVAGSTFITTTAPLGLAVNSEVLVGRDIALTLPIPLTENNVYFIKSIAGNLVELSLTSGGPAITFTSNGNGTIGDFITSGYNYQWFAGVPSPTNAALGSINYFTNPPVYSAGALSSTSTISGLATGLYTVQVTDPATGCKNFHSQTLPFIGSHAVLKITKTNSTICTPGFATGNGSIEIQIESPASAPPGTDESDYEITLKKGVAVTVPTFTGPVGFAPFFVANNILAPGSYVVEVKETYSTFDCIIAQDVIIDSDALTPVISLTGPIIPNTACTVAGADGRIDIHVDKDPQDVTAGTTYTIDFAPDPNAAFPLAAQPAGNYSALNLSPQTYTVTALASTGCAATKAFTVIDNPVKSELSLPDLIITEAEFCDSNLETTAKAVINQIKLVDGGAENINDYQFDWFTNATLTTNILSAIGDNSATKGGEELSNVGAPLPSQKVTNQDYWVVATKTTDLTGTGGVGCVSPPLKFRIDENKVSPQILLTPTGDPSCDPSVFQGNITVDVTTASGPGAGMLYNYTWAPNGGAGQPTNSVGNSGIANVLNNLNEGLYTLTALNQTTGCAATLSTTLVKVTPPVITVDATPTNLTNCVSPGFPFNGRIDGVQVFVDGLPGTVTDFDYVWFRSDLLPASKVLDGQNVAVPVDDQLTLATYPAIAVDKYFVKAIRKSGGAGIGCESAPLRKDILDDKVLPQVSVSSTPNDACIAPNWNGSITVNAGTTGFGVGTLYNFTWQSNPGTAGIVVTNGTNQASVAPVAPSLLSLSTYNTPGSDQIGAGDYVVRVLNQTNGCTTDATVTVIQNTVPVAVTADALPRTHCVLLDGSANVTGVTVGGGAGVIGEFSYNWTGTGGPYVVSNPGNLDVGDYIVTATKNSIATSRTAFGCSSAPVTVKVLDNRTNPDVIISSTPNDACIAPNWNGSITVKTGTTGFGVGTLYNFTWQSNPGTAGIVVTNGTNQASVAPVAPSLLSLSTYNTPGSDQIGAGHYVVRVLNQTNGCATDATVTVIQNTVPVAVTADALPRTHCVLLDGSANVTGVTVGGGAGVIGEFSYNWTGTGGPYVVSNPGNLDVGDYIVTATKNSIATSRTAFGCSSAPVTVKVLDNRTNPDVIVSSTPNDACIAPNWNGSITVKTGTTGFGAGTLYNFTWQSNPGTAGIVVTNGTNQASVAPVAPSLLSLSTYNTPGSDQIGAGDYVVRVLNQTNGCTTDATVTVIQNTVPVAVTADALPRTHCVLLDGSANVTGVTVGGGAGVIGEFSYNWTGTGGPYVVSNPGNLDVGDYTVTATKNSIATSRTAFGCSSAPFTVRVLKEQILPTISFTSQPNTACDTNFDGQITVIATTASLQPAVANSNYDFDWTTNPGGGVVVADRLNQASPYTTLPADRIGAGTYTIRVTNLANQCFMDASFLELSAPGQIQIVNTSKLDQLICNPDGQITVNDVFVNGMVDGNHNNFRFDWYQTSTANPTILSGANEDVLNSTNFPIMGKGIYFVRAERIAGVSLGSGCISSPVRVDVDDLHVNPLIAAATINPDLNCSGATNGAGSIQINEAVPNNFTFAWFTGDDISGAPVLTTAGLNGEIAQALEEGNYTVQVRDNASNCVSVERYNIQNNPTTVSFNLAGFTAPAITTCNLATGIPVNGSATVSSILENNVAQALTNYTFNWAIKDGLPLPGNLPTLSNLSPGSYIVTATNTVSNCVADFEFKVEDKTIGTTTVTLASFVQPERCVDPKDGSLTALASGTGASYSYEWFAGDERPAPAGAVVANTATLANVVVTPPQTDITFTVKAINANNNCWAVDAFTVPVIINPVILSASTSPLTFCSADNGEAFATIANDNKFDYDYFWSNGNVVKPVADFIGNDYTGLPAGTYTVVAIDKLNNTCVSQTLSVIVTNEQVIPVVSARVLQDLTICDPTQPDGVASADVAGDVIHYTFDWFTGTTTAGVSFYSGSEVSRLAATDYAVLAKENTTGCTASATVKVKENFAIIPDPTIVKISDVTSCKKDNGELSVSVGGVTKDYIFDWANGTSAPPPIDFTGEFYKDLSIGSYTVIATSRITGCVSKPKTESIKKDQIFPKMDFLIQNASCTDANGFITILVQDDLPIDSVTWLQNGAVIAVGPNLQNALSGTYQVSIITTEGCEVIQDVFLPADIQPFNGVSRTNDNQNDFFTIDCIENFPNNHVEVYNRAGTKVYEADGYNNLDIIFEGKSNQGISIMGTNLPAGTYYYVISKGDGSNRLAGYLELVD